MVSRILHLLLLAAVLLLCVNTQAAVIASVDRADVEINESFTLKVLVDTRIDLEPDASALDVDFHIGQRTQITNTTIINGQISRSRTWNYILMARRAGNLVIPSIIVGNEQSNPLHIVVSPQSQALPGEADVFVSTEVDYVSTILFCV